MCPVKDEVNSSLSFCEIKGFHLKVDGNDCCQIKESLLRKTSIDELPEGVKFIFYDETCDGTHQAVSITMTLERLGREIVLRVIETGNVENWLSKDLMEEYFESQIRQHKNRQKENFDLIVEIDKKDLIGYSLLVKEYDMNEIINLSEIIYLNVKENSYRFNLN